jgi:hypothetical protein
MYAPRSIYSLCFHTSASNSTNFVFWQADFMREDTMKRQTLGDVIVVALWLHHVLRIAGWCSIEVLDPPCSEDHRCPSRRGAPGQLGRDYFVGYFIILITRLTVQNLYWVTSIFFINHEFLKHWICWHTKRHHLRYVRSMLGIVLPLDILQVWLGYAFYRTSG